jgi:hypothetical protein
MSTWRDSASPQAQRDLNELLNAVLGFAQRQLENRGEFYPYAAAIRTDGQTEMIAGQPDPDGGDLTANKVMESCMAALMSRQHAIRAAALTANVRIAEVDSDAIEVALEHAEGQALRAVLPYAIQGSGIDYGDLRASIGSRRIWSHS